MVLRLTILKVSANKKKIIAVKFFAKCVRYKSCEDNFPPTSPKGLDLFAQTDFCVLEDFATN